MAARARPAADRVTSTLRAVFVVVAAFYLWVAATSKLLLLHGRSSEPYNRLADALLHFHLSIGPAPAALLHLADPYDPAQNLPIQRRFPIHDLALYHGHLFLTWGPAPVVVLLVPMHLLGFEPSASVVVAIFAIAGLGFALATLRVILRQLGDTSLWMCVLAALTLALCTAVSFILRRPAVYEEAISGGYCFAMAGIWLAVSALADRGAPLWRLALMSLCFGLAAGSRPPLGLLAAMLLPVYLALHGTRPRRGLLIALLVPIGGCVLLLAAYDQARFGSPLNYGSRYQLADIDSYTAPFASLSYLPAGLWSYVMSTPRALALFPFIRLLARPSLYPVARTLSANVAEPVGGLLPMTPIAIFLAALPWIWRRRPALLGPLAGPLLLLAGVGVGCLLFLSYRFFSATERYAVDFTTLLLLGALAAWLALSQTLQGWRRRLVRTGGGLLAIVGCLTGLAISFTGSENLLALSLPGTWATLVNLGAPLSTAIAAAAGHPVLGEVSVSSSTQSSQVRDPSLSSGVPPTFSLGVGGQANLTIVSPGSRDATLLARVAPGPALGAGASLWAVVGELGHASNSYPLPAGGGVVHIPLTLGPGVDHLVFSPLASAIRVGARGAPSAQPLLSVSNLSLAGG
jgi:hypothetical protein